MRTTGRQHQGRAVTLHYPPSAGSRSGPPPLGVGAEESTCATSDEPIRVLLVEDHRSFRQALAFMLGREPDIVVVGEVGSLAAARPRLVEVDVLVLDLDLPDGEGTSLIQDLHAVRPGGSALVLTASADRIDLAAAVAAGANGLLHKSVPIATIVEAVRHLCAGEPVLTTPELVALTRQGQRLRAENRVAEQALGRLTPREREVLECLAKGLGDKEIAGRLHVSKDTVHTHMVNLLGKLGVESRLQALILAVRVGAVTLE